MADEGKQTGRHVAYSLAAGAVVGGATDSQAQIVYNPPFDGGISIAQGGALLLNLDGDAYVDVLLKNYTFSGGNYQGATAFEFDGRDDEVEVVGFPAGANYFNYARSLAPGYVIDLSATSNYSNDASLSYGANNPNGQFDNAPNAFLGLRFAIGPAAGDPGNGIPPVPISQPHFGWVRVSIDNAGGTFIVRDWAYNNVPGEPILAGQVAGDYNRDGFVDAADYTIYRDTFGSTTDLRADGDGDGVAGSDDPFVNPGEDGDYATWATDYGFSVDDPLAKNELPPAAATPEPVSLGLLAAGALGVGLMRRRYDPLREANRTGEPDRS